MPLPLDDAQFYIVSAIALAALAFIFRGFLPSRRRRKRKGERPATLTISGKRVGTSAGGARAGSGGASEDGPSGAAGPTLSGSTPTEPRSTQ
ncbi:MAG: hypothetical protein SFZ23_05515 [Planctomycetota bacterium]|nr:hypothetical protein [Planctomycetota bacterium]